MITLSKIVLGYKIDDHVYTARTRYLVATFGTSSPGIEAKASQLVNIEFPDSKVYDTRDYERVMLVVIYTASNRQQDEDLIEGVVQHELGSVNPKHRWVTLVIRRGLSLRWRLRILSESLLVSG